MSWTKLSQKVRTTSSPDLRFRPLQSAGGGIFMDSIANFRLSVPHVPLIFFIY